MSESELSKKLTKTIKSIDKMLNDLVKNGQEVKEALRELKEGKDEEKPETK